MSVKMILSNTYNQAFNAVLRELKQVSNSGRNVVIVPDKFSLSLEQSILLKLGIKGSFNIEVMSFTRFASKTLKNNIKRCLTPEGAVMLMQKAVNNVQNQLIIYGNSAYQSGFAREIYAVLTAIRNSGITPKMLMEKGDEFFEEDVNLKQKLLDISLIYSEYLALLENNHSDSSTRLEAFADFIPLMDDIAKTNIFICDFYNFTVPQYDIIEKLIANAKTVTFGFVRAVENSANGRIYPKAHIENIKKFCQLSNQHLTIIENDEILPKYKELIATELFSYGQSKFKINTKLKENLEINVASDTISEVEYTAKEIKKLIIEKNLRYSDISIVVGDMKLYEMNVQNIFSRFDIPFFIDKKESFYEQPAIKFMLNALKAVDNNLEFNSLLEMVKNPFFYIDIGGYDKVASFENYCLKMSVNGEDFFEKFKNTDDNCFIDAEEVRLKAIKVLEALMFEKNKKLKVKGYLDALDKFFKITKFYEKIEKIPNSLLHSGDEFKRMSEQIEEKVKDIFFEMRLTIGEDEMSFKSFILMLNSVFEGITLALVPLYLDSVFVGEMKESRYDNAKVMFILGALDNKIPFVSADTAVISIKDEEKLINKGLKLMPTKKENAWYELFNITQLLLKPQKKLYISYPENADGEGKPSVLVTQILNLFIVDKHERKANLIVDEFYKDNIKLSELERAKLYAYKFCSQKNAFHQILANIANEGPVPSRMEPYDAVYQLLSNEYKNSLNKYLMPKTNIKDNVEKGVLVSSTYSASRLENYFLCPYRHYFSYGLHLKKREEGILQTTDIGSIIHEILEEFVKQNMYENKDAYKLNQFIETVFNKVLSNDKYKKMNTNLHKNTFDRLKIECISICEAIGLNIQNSRFKPYKAEPKVGKLEEFSGADIIVDGKTITLLGFIDRIDIYENYYTIIDYKSYNKNLTFSEIYSGKCIQPILYMLAVNESRNDIHPCGLLYQPTTLGFKTKADDRFKMKGLVIDDLNVLSNLDINLSPNEKSTMLPISLTSKGKINGRCTSAIKDTEFTQIGRYVYKLSENAMTEIYNGNITPCPIKDACKFCDFSSICIYADDEDYERRSFPKIKADSFAKIINEKNINKLDNSCCEVEND